MSEATENRRGGSNASPPVPSPRRGGDRGYGGASLWRPSAGDALEGVVVAACGRWPTVSGVHLTLVIERDDGSRVHAMRAWWPSLHEALVAASPRVGDRMRLERLADDGGRRRFRVERVGAPELTPI